MPATSGNAINGLGETAFRRASRVDWHDPDTIEHGELQKWFYTQDPDNPAIVKARAARAKILDIEEPPVTGEPLEQSAEDWSQDLAAYAGTRELELFGITALKPEWAYEGVSAGLPMGNHDRCGARLRANEDCAGGPGRCRSRAAIRKGSQSLQRHCRMDKATRVGCGPACGAPGRAAADDSTGARVWIWRTRQAWLDYQPGLWLILQACSRAHERAPGARRQLRPITMSTTFAAVARSARNACPPDAIGPEKSSGSR